MPIRENSFVTIREILGNVCAKTIYAMRQKGGCLAHRNKVRNENAARKVGGAEY